MNDWPHIKVPTNETGEPHPYDVVIDPRTGKPHRGLSLDELADLVEHDKRLIAEESDDSRDGNADE